MKNYLVFILAALLLFVVAWFSLAALAGPERSKLVIAGEGSVKAAADIAYLTLGVEKTERTAVAAQQAVSQKVTAILAALAKNGIAGEKIETDRITIYPQYRYDRGVDRTLTGYTAGNQLRVTVDSPGKLGELIDAALAAGATNINQLAFSLKNDQPLRRAALAAAYRDAREKAEVVAAAAGLVIERIETVQEAAAQIVPLEPPVRAFRAEGLGGGVETPVSPGQIEVKGRLTAVFQAAVRK